MQPVHLAQHSVQVGGQSIHYRSAGSGDPIVLVHGLAGSTRWWSRNLAALAARHRVYLVDLPGFGALRRQAGGFALAEAAAWLLAWMEAVNLRQAHLVGHSMGGYIAIRLAVAHPQVVRRLILVAAAGVPSGRSLVRHLIPLARALRHARPGFLPVLAYDALRAGAPTLWRASRQLLAQDVRERLASIAAPTLLVWGENDALIHPALGHVLREEIPDSRLVILPGAGHVPMFDRPAEFNAVMLRFLAGEPVGA